jgi:toxin secretion/phage lysis holin
MERFSVSAILAAICAILLTIFGVWSTAMTALVILIALDIVSGWTRAIIQKELTSDASWKGMLKKMLVILAVAVAAQADILVKSDELIRDAVVIFYCATEGLSILENLAAAGLPIPKVLRDALMGLNHKKFKPPPPHG